MLACVRQGAAQHPAPDPRRSTRAGVYTADQAAQGRELYALRCRSCHTPGEHGATVRAKWSGRALSELFQYLGENMPKDSPGTLTSYENAVALAYFLQMAGLPPGNEELPADSAGLSRIEFDTLATKETKP